MCGRFTLTSEIKELRDQFSVHNHIKYHTSYNIPPTRDIPVVRLHDGQRQLALCHWGLIPHWSKPDNKYKAINARAETIATKPYFRDAYHKRRCLIPANGFYEWKQQNGAKQAYYIHLKNHPLFAFAGLWEYWEGPDRVFDSCSIITTAANPIMQTIHDRMPVIIDQDNYNAWLENGGADLLVPYTGAMTCYAVQKYVNNPRNDGKDLIEQIKQG